MNTIVITVEFTESDIEARAMRLVANMVLSGTKPKPMLAEAVEYEFNNNSVRLYSHTVYINNVSFNIQNDKHLLILKTLINNAKARMLSSIGA